MKPGVNGITFTATIFPMTLSGHRMRTPKDMLVMVSTAGRAQKSFTVQVQYVKGARILTHFYRAAVPAADVAATMAALDFNGTAVLDPSLDPKA